jgi:DNA helicase II / ATP-dependent DNA helicase PcrA
MQLNMRDLNPVQVQAVTSEKKHILILAGAGSGKTRTLTYRIAHLIQKKKVDPGQILAMTFTNKAAREMYNRLQILVKTDFAKLWIGTFHSLFARILRLEASHLPYSRAFTIYDSDDQVSAVRKVMSTLNIPQQVYPPKLFQTRISHAKNLLLTAEDVEKKARDEFEQSLAEVFRRYNAYLIENNAMDFDDLLLVPIKLFARHPELLRKYQKKFRHILVDEYQDTNKPQYQIIHHLAHKDNHICVVGDEDQAIYRWRGADINNILNFDKDFPDTHVIRLEENYRSNKNILQGANAVVAHNQERLGKKLWTNKQKGDPIVIMEAENEIEEAKMVVENLHNEMYSNKRTFRDIAVLYRTNAQSRALEDELRKNALNYTVVGGLKFYERKEIKDILAYLKVITNQADGVSLRRIVNFPLRGIGETTVTKIEKYAETLKISLFEGMGRVGEISSISAGMANRVVEFYELINKYRTLSKEISPSELASSLAQETGIITHIKNEYDQYESESRLENIYELFNSIESFTLERTKQKKDSSLSVYLEEVALVADIDEYDSDKNAITLLTLHSAKGLEFPVVFITGLEMGLFPLQRNTAEKAELEEERRLLYVGMTRAQDNLYLSFARSRRKYNSLVVNEPSLFLDEIPPEFTELRTSRKTERIYSKKRKQSHRKKVLDYFRHHELSQENQVLFEVGTPVYHETFGKGKVVGVEGHGNKMKISVHFEGNIHKKLIAQYANLTRRETDE